MSRWVQGQRNFNCLRQKRISFFSQFIYLSLLCFCCSPSFRPWNNKMVWTLCYGGAFEVAGGASKFSGHLWEPVQWLSGSIYISCSNVHVPLRLRVCFHVCACSHRSWLCLCLCVWRERAQIWCVHAWKRSRCSLFHSHADLWPSTWSFPGHHKSQRTNCIGDRRAHARVWVWIK